MENSQTKIQQLSGNKVKCVKCGYIWKPKFESPGSCANKKCRRKIIYDPEPQLEPENVIDGDYIIKKEEDPEEDSSSHIYDQHEDMEAEESLEKTEEIPQDNHPKSAEETDGSQVHEGTGLRMKDLHNLADPSNPQGLYTNQDQLRNPSSGKTLKESPIKIPDPDPEVLSPLMGGIFQQGDHQEAASQEISGFLKKHKSTMETKIAEKGVERASGGLFGGIDMIWIDGVKMVGKLLMMKLNENKVESERKRVSEMLKADKEGPSHPQPINTPKPTTQSRKMRIMDPDPNRGSTQWDALTDGFEYDPNFGKDPMTEESFGNAPQEESQEIKPIDYDPHFGREDPDESHENEMTEPKQVKKEMEKLQPDNIEGLKVTKEEFNQGLDWILNFVSLVPESQIKGAIETNQNIVKDYEGMILGMMSPQMIENLKLIFKIDENYLNQMIGQFADLNQDNGNLQLINTPEGLEWIHYTLNNFEEKLRELGL